MRRAGGSAKIPPMNCPCSSGRALAECCGPYLEGQAWPDTAEKLMRARYSAFATGNIDFIHNTFNPSNQDDLDRESTKAWSEQSEWIGMEVLGTEGGGTGDETGVVEFVANYRLQGTDHAHHEVASFEKVDGRWYFMDGQVAGQEPYRREAPKVGRNDPCPCGSGKKFKKCCADS